MSLRRAESCGFTPRFLFLYFGLAVFGNAVKVLVAADEEIVADDYRRGVDGLVEFVGRDDFEGLRVFEHG